MEFQIPTSAATEISSVSKSAVLFSSFPVILPVFTMSFDTWWSSSGVLCSGSRTLGCYFISAILNGHAGKMNRIRADFPQKEQAVGSLDGFDDLCLLLQTVNPFNLQAVTPVPWSGGLEGWRLALVAPGAWIGYAPVHPRDRASFIY